MMGWYEQEFDEEALHDEPYHPSAIRTIWISDFFLAFSLGPFGIPVPNELTLLTGGILSNQGVLNPWLTYVSMLSGLLIAITLSYFIGKVSGETLTSRFGHNRYFQQAERIFRQRGDMAVCLGLFLPVVRYVMPAWVGLSGMSFRKFALISYFTAFFWTLTVFMIGRYFKGFWLN